MGLWDDLFRAAGQIEDNVQFDSISGVTEATDPRLGNGGSSSSSSLAKKPAEDAPPTKGAKSLTNKQKFQKRMAERAKEKEKKSEEKEKKAKAAEEKKQAREEGGAGGNERMEESAKAHDDGMRLEEGRDLAESRKQDAESAQKKMESSTQTHNQINSIMGSPNELGSQIKSALSVESSKKGSDEFASMAGMMEDEYGLSGLTVTARNELG